MKTAIFKERDERCRIYFVELKFTACYKNQFRNNERSQFFQAYKKYYFLLKHLSEICLSITTVSLIQRIQRIIKTQFLSYAPSGIRLLQESVFIITSRRELLRYQNGVTFQRCPITILTIVFSPRLV